MVEEASNLYSGKLVQESGTLLPVHSKSLVSPLFLLQPKPLARGNRFLLGSRTLLLFPSRDARYKVNPLLYEFQSVGFLSKWKY